MRSVKFENVLFIIFGITLFRVFAKVFDLFPLLLPLAGTGILLWGAILFFRQIDSLPTEKESQIYRALKKSARSTNAEGPVMLRGTVVPKKTFSSPLSRKESVLVNVQGKSFRSHKYPLKFSYLSFTEKTPFWLKVNGQYIQIDTGGKSLEVPLSSYMRKHVQVMERKELQKATDSSQVRKILLRPGIISCSDATHWDLVEFHERCIEPGQELTLCGTLVHENASNSKSPYRTSEEKLSLKEGAWGDVLFSRTPPDELFQSMKTTRIRSMLLFTLSASLLLGGVLFWVAFVTKHFHGF